VVEGKGLVRRIVTTGLHWDWWRVDVHSVCYCAPSTPGDNYLYINYFLLYDLSFFSVELNREIFQKSCTIIDCATMYQARTSAQMNPKVALKIYFELSSSFPPLLLPIASYALV